MTKLVTIVLTCLLAMSSLTYAQRHGQAEERRQDRREERRQDNRQERRQDRRQEIRQERRQDHRQERRHTIIKRRRTVRGVVVYRPYGRLYYGFGHHHDDHDAWKWLAFTAISLKILDLVSEEAQRQHEQAIIEASTASVGTKIEWEEDNAQGYVVATKQGRDENGLTCREFQQEITVGDKIEQGYGTACLQADGSGKSFNND